MNHADLVALIEDGITQRGGRWADLGSGEGAFTLALADLLGPGSNITAVDRDAAALRYLQRDRFPGVEIETIAADFTRPLALSSLDGIVMANSLHFVRDRAPVLESVRKMLRPGGRLIVVEYGTDHGNPWVPHPFSYERWEKMAAQAGFVKTRLLRTIPSRHLGQIYSACSLSPSGGEGLKPPKRSATEIPPAGARAGRGAATSARSSPARRRSNDRHRPD